jgi:TPR repeat protein/serine/threonine protein kinase
MSKKIAVSDDKEDSSVVTLDFSVQLKDITLGRLLGEGSYGKVHFGEWNLNEVAVKLFTIQNFTEKTKKEIRQEALVMATAGTQSDYLVRLKGMILEKPHYALVMEYMSGGDLYHFLHEDREISWTVRYRIGIDIASGLHHLHQHAVIHRDLKSLNVLLDSNGRAKLADFGLSTLKASSSSDTSGGLKGTVLWTAPELFKRGAKATTASDIYSLAMVLWELASRKVPFAEATSAGVAAAWVAQGEQETIPENAPEEFKSLILESWNKTPEKRPSAETLAKRLDSLWKAECKKTPTTAPINQTTSVSGSTSVSTMKYDVQSGKPLPTAALVTQMLAKTELGELAHLGETDFRQGLVHYQLVHYSRALALFKIAAEKLYPPADLFLGYMFSYGQGVPKDASIAKTYFDKARQQITWFQKQVKMGSAEALYWMALYCENKAGEEKDIGRAEAVVWYRKAADLGHAQAQVNLGYCYENGEGVLKDAKEAIVWYRKAADQGDADGQNGLAWCYREGIGIVQDSKKAVHLYCKAADQGHASAQNSLGRCYKTGTGIEKDVKKAVLWYRKAAEQGHDKAQNELGNCYYYGTGVVKNVEEATLWYRKASDQGNATAQNNLGHCYQNGIGVTQDAKEAVVWYRRAADQGYYGAQYNLGCCYEKGIGITKNAQQAMRYFQLAADQGDQLAKEGVERLRRLGISVSVATSAYTTFNSSSGREMASTSAPGGSSSKQFKNLGR